MSLSCLLGVIEAAAALLFVQFVTKSLLFPSFPPSPSPATQRPRCATIEDARVFCDIAYDKTPPEYFFDRNGENFSSILGTDDGGRPSKNQMGMR